jgi:hypothetical protein
MVDVLLMLFDQRFEMNPNLFPIYRVHLKKDAAADDNQRDKRNEDDDKDDVAPKWTIVLIARIGPLGFITSVLSGEEAVATTPPGSEQKAGQIACQGTFSAST